MDVWILNDPINAMDVVAAVCVFLITPAIFIVVAFYPKKPRD